MVAKKKSLSELKSRMEYARKHTVAAKLKKKIHSGKPPAFSLFYAERKHGRKFSRV